MSVYLIHFEEPYHHARHYVGYSDDVYRRIREHQNGNGARLIEVINDAGISWRVARVWWSAGRDFERCIKRQHNTRRFCPICQAEIQLRFNWFAVWDTIEELDF